MPYNSERNNTFGMFKVRYGEYWDENVMIDELVLDVLLQLM